MKTSLFAVVTVLALASPLVAGNELTLSSKFPVVGRDEPVQLKGWFLPSGIQLKVVYRPNSETVEERIVGTFDAEGRIKWRPDSPGITVLTAIAPDGSVLATKKVATCFAAPPPVGLLVMIVAGILLFGGAATSLVLALRRDPVQSDP